MALCAWFTATASSPTAGRVELVGELSSLTMTRQDNGIRVEPDPAVLQRFLLRRGRPEDDSRFHGRIVEWLRERARTRHLDARLALQLRSDNLNLVELTIDHSDVVARLLPTPAEYSELTATDRELVRHWVRTYVGQWRPRLRITVDNSQNRDHVQIVAVLYDVAAIGRFRGGVPPGPPLPQYAFRLAHRTGVQRFALAAQGTELTVAAGAVSTFDAVFAPETEAPVAATWDGSLKLETTRGLLPIGRLQLETFNAESPDVSSSVTPRP